MYFVSVVCCCGLCVPNMIITKANAKENLGEFMCLSITKAKATTNPQIYICNSFRADGIQEPRKEGFSKGGFCRAECHAPGSKKIPKDIGPSSTFGTQSGTAKEAYISQKPSSQNPSSWLLIYGESPKVLRRVLFGDCQKVPWECSRECPGNWE